MVTGLGRTHFGHTGDGACSDVSHQHVHRLSRCPLRLTSGELVDEGEGLRFGGHDECGGGGRGVGNECVREWSVCVVDNRCWGKNGSRVVLAPVGLHAIDKIL